MSGELNPLSVGSLGPAGPDQPGGQNAFLKDFDILAPPKRIARLGGKDIDVSFLSARVAMKFIEFSSKFDMEAVKNATKIDPLLMDGIIEIIAMVCKPSAPEFDKDYLLDRVDITILIEFMAYVFEPLNARVKTMDGTFAGPGGAGEPGGEPGKN